MHAFVINLKKSVDRRAHMENILQAEKGLTYEFIPAVDGRLLSEEEKSRVFDVQKSERKCAKKITPGEIGCTLSHQKCYRKLAESEELDAVLILEDDILIKENVSQACSIAEPLLKTDEPTVILLSGWYWFTSKKAMGGSYSVAKVFDAFLTQSYLINKAAARLLVEEKPFIRADDWRYIRKKGVKIYALLPHVVNQDWSGKLPSTLYTENPFFKGHLLTKCRIHVHACILKLLARLGHYESAE